MQLLQQHKSVPVRQHHIQQDQVRMLPAKYLLCLPAAARRHHLSESLFQQKFPHHPAQRRFVVHDHDLVFMQIHVSLHVSLSSSAGHVPKTLLCLKYTIFSRFPKPLRIILKVNVM